MTDTVTTDKPKNQGRQEWGRKLGKMSKELKLKKQVIDISKAAEGTKSIFRVEYLLGLAGLVIGLGALYYQKKSYESAGSNIAQPRGNTDTSKVKPEVKFSDF